MRSTLILLTCLAALAFGAAPASASIDTVLSFDGLLTGTVVTTQYEGSHGITFGRASGFNIPVSPHRPECASDNARIISPGIFGPSLEIRCGGNEFLGKFGTAFQFQFQQRSVLFSILQGGSNPDDTARVEAFSADGSLLHSQDITLRAGAQRFVSITRPSSQIAVVVISGFIPTQTAYPIMIDDLFYSRDSPPPTLTVSTAGTGAGTVTSSPSGINCGTTCSANFPENTQVSLTATPAAGSTFAGWGGMCAGTGPCVVTMSQARSVSATFTSTATHALSVTKSGTGSGTVTSSPAGINCGQTCAASFLEQTQVSLTATPAAGSTFAGWSGACSGTSTCVMSMSQARSVTATFTTGVPVTLSVTKTGTGTGIVTSAPAGISCGATCATAFAQGTVVTLTPSAASGSTFAGWSGACTGTDACVVTMDQARSVTVTFTAVATTHALEVTKSGTGSGTVTSSPAGINCGQFCFANWASGTQVTLTATPAAGSTFAGWGAPCSGTGTCVVTMNQARTVTATFTPAPTSHTLTVTKAGTGSGTVTSSPAGINCGATCSDTWVAGTQVTLIATPAAGSTFAGWDGACSGTGGCVVTMSQARSVTATFTATATHTLTVTRAGTGSGTVTSTPAGITCGPTCTGTWASGTQVTLTPSAATGSTFAGWSGSCTGTGACTVTMSQARSVTATFNAVPVTRTLTVTKAGSAPGSITSTPAGINCPTTCSASFADGAQVTLTPTVPGGSDFDGWSGDCSGHNPCVVTMSQARSVTGTFVAAPSTHTLTVSKAGTGSGTVTSNPTGIACGPTCSAPLSRPGSDGDF